MTQIAAIFDLDRTLLSETSSTLIWRYLHETGQYTRYFRRRDLIPVLSSILLYSVGVVSAERAMQRIAAVTEGIRVDEFWELIRRWFEEMVVNAIAPRGRAQLDWHRAQGHIPVICSAANQFSVQPVADHLNIEHTIHTDWLVANGRLTGQVRQPIVYGTGKVYWMERWAALHNVSLTHSYFYTDHISDLPLLHVVANPVAVNPDRRLQRWAIERGWPVLHWA